MGLMVVVVLSVCVCCGVVSFRRRSPEGHGVSGAPAHAYLAVPLLLFGLVHGMSHLGSGVPMANAVSGIVLLASGVATVVTGALSLSSGHRRPMRVHRICALALALALVVHISLAVAL